MGKSALLHFLDVYETCVELQQSHCQKPEIMYILIKCIIIHTILHTGTVHKSEFYTTKWTKRLVGHATCWLWPVSDIKKHTHNFSSCCIQLLMWHVLNRTVWAYKQEGKDKKKTSGGNLFCTLHYYYGSQIKHRRDDNIMVELRQRGQDNMD